MILRDILYGSIEVPDGLVPFLRIPEFVRLRGVRLSNIDSIEFKDLNGPSRWEHALGVLHLAKICASERGMNYTDRMHLSLAALLHDVATPPFAHTAEYVIADFDHEMETSDLLGEIQSEDVSPHTAVYLGEVPQFRKVCAQVSSVVGADIDPDEVARMVVGEGELGYLISGTLDLDNADNVTRASHYMGLNVDRFLPERLARWLAAFDTAPLELEESKNPDVAEWLKYRSAMYGSFYDSSNDERGREAYLQHIFRRAIASAVPRRTLVWNTDDGFLGALENFKADLNDSRLSLRELVRRYRLMEQPYKLVSLKIFDPELFRVLRMANASAWIEEKLSTSYLECLVIVSARRFQRAEDETTLIGEAGKLEVFKLGEGVSFKMLPDWLQERVGHPVTGSMLERKVIDVLGSDLPTWMEQRPWLRFSQRRAARVKERLEAMGDWNFRRSMNESVHAYPATFVHTIPASLIHALGIAGEDVLDFFGGTGQTAIEAVKTGGRGVSADSNSVATLIARVRTSYLPAQSREFLNEVTWECLRDSDPSPMPPVKDIERWHHRQTLEELRYIKGYIDSVNDLSIREFLLVAFSGILAGTTGRRGEQHGFFADNTPLERGRDEAAYVDAIEIFIKRIRQNLKIMEALYGSLEKSGESAADVLKRATVLCQDVRGSRPIDYGVSANTIAAVITSPPYLCMTDYTLGNRLSYYWLSPDQMKVDFEREISPRRKRPRSTSGKPVVDRVVSNYRAEVASFVEMAKQLLRPGGYFAMVLGKPRALAFEDCDIYEDVDRILEEAGFGLVWSDWRDISWSRNHGYERLKRERLSVHQI